MPARDRTWTILTWLPMALLLALLAAAVGRAWLVRRHVEAAWARTVAEERALGRELTAGGTDEPLERRRVLAEARIERGRNALRPPPSGAAAPADVAGLLVGLAALWDECRGRAAWEDIPFPRGDGLERLGVEAGLIAPEAIPRLWYVGSARAQVLEALLDAQPRAIASVGDGSFVPDGTAGARVNLAGMAALEGRFFRVEFSGSTAVLRDFLNQLARSDWPVFVRSVERLPAADGGEDAAVAGPRPLFRVVVECVPWREPTEVAAR